ncbi:MAG: pyridoxamine 5'-phosphate oxidase [Porticoccaceae bacterium]|nr:MAG: pyridoxamine 5'-phosphate oxidase [Porticoccaceae bacterium]
MGQTYAGIDAALAAWIERQKLFFVATAPLAADGRVNLSPKGGDSLRILAPDRVVWRDLTGSGVETIAHLRENGRITMMFCAFEGPPRILRLYGRGEVVLPGDDDHPALAAHFPDDPGHRAFIRVWLTRIADSCGYGVPRFSYLGEREALARWAADQGPEGLARYRREHNRTSIDGLPALDGERDRAVKDRSDSAPR